MSDHIVLNLLNKLRKRDKMFTNKRRITEMYFMKLRVCFVGLYARKPIFVIHEQLSAFIISFLRSIISKRATSEILTFKLVYVDEQTNWCMIMLEDRFAHHEARLFNSCTMSYM